MRAHWLILVVLALLIVACTPPGAQPIDKLVQKSAQQKTTPAEQAGQTAKDDTSESADQQTPKTTPSESETSTTGSQTGPSETQTPSNLDEATDFTEKSVDCVAGTFKCKDTRLLECRYGKLIQKEDCGSRGCYVNHCGECDTEVPIECQGNKLVKCTADARKKVTDCYQCKNNACVAPPENPGPFECSEVTNLEIKNPEALTAYSQFKKTDVKQELVVNNNVEDGGQVLARAYASGAYDQTRGPTGRSPVFLTLDKCYIYCILEQPLQVTFTCDGNREVTATVPATGFQAATPIRFFVGEEGSTFFGDDQRNGQGNQLAIDDVYTKAQLAVKADI